MIIVDVEATGVDARLCSLLSVGAVEFEKPVNAFYAECYAFEGSHIEKEALKISGFKMEDIAACNQQLTTNNQKKITDREVIEQFLAWMKTCAEWTLAGQNPSFDRDFLQETAHRYHINWPLAHRTVDIHSVAYYHLKRAGKTVPQKNNHSALNLDQILKYVGLPTRAKKHNALLDAKCEAEALSRLMRGAALLDEFRSFAVPEYLLRGDHDRA